MPSPADNPTIKVLTWLVSIVGGSIGVWLWLDSYFVHRAEAQAMKAEYTTQIAQLAQNSQRDAQELKLQVEYSADQNAKRVIDNRLFELEQIPPAQMKPSDRALYQKLLRDRQELVSLWNRRGRPLR